MIVVTIEIYPSSGGRPTLLNRMKIWNNRASGSNRYGHYGVELEECIGGVCKRTIKGDELLPVFDRRQPAWKLVANVLMSLIGKDE